MLVLGIQGSPRKNGNTRRLMAEFMDAAEKLGARTRTIHAAEADIGPCKELIVCEKKGFCPIKDDMKSEVYSLIREAEVIVVGTPIFFFGPSAQTKMLMDRCQLFWARKYRFKLADPLSKIRKGLLLSLGATKFKNLFDAVTLITRYFFDAIDAHSDGSLLYRGLENPGDVEKHESALADARAEAERVVGPLARRKKVLFAGVRDAARSQMAAAFTQILAGERIDAFHAGVSPADAPDVAMVAAMAEKGVDMALRRTIGLADALETFPAELIVTLDGAVDGSSFPAGVERVSWDLPDLSDASPVEAAAARDDIEQRVAALLENI